MNQNLPQSNCVNATVLPQIFNNTTNSYKYVYFLSLLDIIKRSNFEVLLPISFQEIVIEMLANTWYPHNYFKLSFGKQDQLANKLDALELKITEPILNFRDTDKKLLKKEISNQPIHDIVDFISRYVPFRLIRPFFAQETKGLKDHEVNQCLIRLANTQFDNYQPLYCFNTEELKDCNAIILNQNWIKYFAQNYSIVRGWISWEWLNYMQKINPNIPNVANKLFMPQQRDSLNNQTKYWQYILGSQEIECIYSNLKLSQGPISLDHYLPWSFLAHDQLWNLIPTIPSVNSSKSNNLPSMQYFDDFVKLQHLGLTVSCQSLAPKQWLKYTEPFLVDLKINRADDLLELDMLRKAYETTLTPLISLAKIQGFSANWIYIK